MLRRGFSLPGDGGWSWAIRVRTHRSKKLVGHLMRLHATSARLAIRSELAQMKGQMVAIEQASVAKKCDIQFQGKPKD